MASCVQWAILSAEEARLVDDGPVAVHRASLAAQRLEVIDDAVEQLRSGVPRLNDVVFDVREELSAGRVRVPHRPAHGLARVLRPPASRVGARVDAHLEAPRDASL